MGADLQLTNYRQSFWLDGARYRPISWLLYKGRGVTPSKCKYSQMLRNFEELNILNIATRARVRVCKGYLELFPQGYLHP